MDDIDCVNVCTDDNDGDGEYEFDFVWEYEEIADMLWVTDFVTEAVAILVTDGLCDPSAVDVYDNVDVVVVVAVTDSVAEAVCVRVIPVLLEPLGDTDDVFETDTDPVLVLVIIGVCDDLSVIEPVDEILDVRDGANERLWVGEAVDDLENTEVNDWVRLKCDDRLRILVYVRVGLIELVDDKVFELVYLDCREDVWVTDTIDEEEADVDWVDDL